MSLTIGQIEVRGVPFPGPAGDALARNATASFVREVGDNYSYYHDFLAKRLGALLPPPDPRDFRTYPEYAAALDRVHAVVRAEALIRNCAQYRQSGRRLDAAIDLSVPLVDADDNLVDFYHPPASREVIAAARYRRTTAVADAGSATLAP